jgi:modification methylase
VLDPFIGTGTTGAVARRLGRHWIRNRAREEICEGRARTYRLTLALDESAMRTMASKKSQPKVTVGALIETGMIEPGRSSPIQSAAGRRGWGPMPRSSSPASSAASTRSAPRPQGAPVHVTGGTFWHVEQSGALVALDDLRQKYILTLD